MLVSLSKRGDGEREGVQATVGEKVQVFPSCPPHVVALNSTMIQNRCLFYNFQENHSIAALTFNAVRHLLDSAVILPPGRSRWGLAGPVSTVRSVWT